MMADIIDLRTLKYVDKINENLLCCICQTPFIDPIITNCGHTFCQLCIYQALETSNLCPIDRINLCVDEFLPTAKIITNIVNELLVYCPKSEEGCSYYGQRQFIQSHLNNDCEYITVPCQSEECKALLVKKDSPMHASTCQYRLSECNMCHKKFRMFELEIHYKQCPVEVIQCPHCSTSRPRSEHVSHLEECPQLEVGCTFADFGCEWKDKREGLKSHLEQCPYEKIKGYLYKQRDAALYTSNEMKKLHKENEALRRQQIQSENLLEGLTERLELLFPGLFIPNPDIPEEARRESLLSESERVNNQLETLSANIASLELKQNMALMTETFRLQEELQSLRAICHGLRMQMHYLMMERKVHNSNASVGASVVTGGNGSTSTDINMNNEGNTAMGINALNRMRTWFDQSGSRQETKL
ncbi:hypothetical protein BDB01DRAFT_771213 [Pilobolus umbonatus]|nr:hypothetical protein BDB01DRAFT_771213 [Pilobolus umbonatus]